MDLALKIAIVSALAVIIGAFIKLIGDLAGKENPPGGLILSVIILVIGVLGAGIFVLLLPTPDDAEKAPVTENQETETTFPLTGNWSGTIKSDDGSFSTELSLSFEKNCSTSEICGTYDAYQLPCSGTLTLVRIQGDTFIFKETRTGGDEWCGAIYEHIEKISNTSISYGGSQTTSSSDIQSTGILSK